MYIPLCVGPCWIGTVTRCTSSQNHPVHIRGYEDEGLYREHHDSTSQHSVAMAGCVRLRE